MSEQDELDGWRSSHSEQDLENWKLQADVFLMMSELHDAKFRKRHICKCISRVEYSDGRWYCNAMQKARLKNKEIKKVIKEALQDSPFLPSDEETVSNLRKAWRLGNNFD